MKRVLVIFILALFMCLGVAPDSSALKPGLVKIREAFGLDLRNYC
jgi:hypothetical protein